METQNLIKRISRPTNLAGLVLGAACALYLNPLGSKGKHSEKIVEVPKLVINYENRPADYFFAQSPPKRDAKGAYTETEQNLLALDLDGDGKIDELIESYGLYTGTCIGLCFAKNVEECWGQKGVKVNHLVAKGYEKKSFVQSPDTKELGEQERSALSDTYKVLRNKEK